MANGTVEEKAGDGVFKNNRVRQHRGWIGKTLNIMTDYIIEGYITGKINDKDTSVRGEREISIPFNIVDNLLSGFLFLRESWISTMPILPKLSISKKSTSQPEAH
jgi:hypothetical protein